jgi:ribosomal protein L37E
MTHVSWLIASLATFAVSTVLVLIALRGRRVNDHPLCRRCGFDLFGKPPESTVCSECGADLGRRRAVRVGQRERQRWLLQVAGPMLAISVGWSGLLGWDAARLTDWNRHKPVWWLMREVDGRPGPTRDAALVELGRRIAGRSLPPDRSSALVDRALDWQADAGKPWSPGWGVVVESARAADRLTYDKWERYMAQSVTFTLEAFKPGKLFGRGETQESDEGVGLRIRRGPDRVGRARFTVELQLNQGTVLAGQPVYPRRVSKVLPPSELDVPAGGSPVRVGSILQEMIFGAPQARRIPTAPTRATVTVEVRPIRTPNGMVAWLIEALMAKPPTPRTVALTAEWTTLPDDPTLPTTGPAGPGPAAAEFEAADGTVETVGRGP